MNGRTLTLASLAGLVVAGVAARRRGSRDGEDIEVHSSKHEITGVFNGEPVGDILIYPSERALNVTTRDDMGVRILGLPRGPGGYIGGIELPEEARGRGIGERLVREMLDHAVQQDLRWIVLFSEWRPSSFWEKMGFAHLYPDNKVTSGPRYRGDPWPNTPMIWPGTLSLGGSSRAMT